MGRFSPTVAPTSVSPTGTALSSLGDAFFRAYAMRHQQRMAQDAQDAQLAEQGIYRGTAPTGPLTVTPNVGAVPNMPAVSNAADRAALGQTLPGGRTATLGIPIAAPPTAPASAPSSFTVAGPDGRGVADASRYRQINPRLYVDQTETPYARRVELAQLTGETALNRAILSGLLRNQGGVERADAMNAGYGTVGPDGTYTPGVRTYSAATTQTPGLVLGQNRLAETTRHDRAMEARPVGRGGGNVSVGVGGQPSPQEAARITRRIGALEQPQNVVDPTAPYRMAMQVTPGLSPDSARVVATHEANLGRMAVGSDTLPNPPARTGRAVAAPAPSFGFNAAPNPVAPPPAAPAAPRPAAPQAAPTAAPSAQVGGVSSPGALREFQALNAKAAQARAQGRPEARIQAALQADIARISAKYGLTPKR